MLKQIARTLLSEQSRKKIHAFTKGYVVKAYSQEGEDLVLNRLFEGQKEGFYVDIGAHHPKRFSNTYFFYKKGWRGINLDAMPGSMKEFNKVRSRDINLEIPVSSKTQTLTYYSFEETAYNGFSKELSEERINNGIKLNFKKDIQTETLSNILDKHLPENVNIDFMSIDVEGLDLDVLKSNNWDKYKPKIVLIETYGSSLESALSSDINQFLKQHGYLAVAKTVNTCVFKLHT